MDWYIAAVQMVTVMYYNLCGEEKRRPRLLVMCDGKKGYCDIVRIGSKIGWN